MPCEHDGHRERLKDRFINSGLDSFEPHNVLELLLFYSVPRKDTNPLAHKLINHFGSLSAVFDATPEQLMKVEGITKNSAALITMVPQLARKYLEDKADVRNVVSSFDEIGSYLLTRFVGRTVETIMLAGLDNKNKVIACNVVAEGGHDEVSVSKRKIVEESIKMGATKVVLSHNHPRGFAVPSSEDIYLTQSVYQVLKSVGIELLDHIIVAEDDYISFAASGIEFASDE